MPSDHIKEGKLPDYTGQVGLQMGGIQAGAIVTCRSCCCAIFSIGRQAELHEQRAQDVGEIIGNFDTMINLWLSCAAEFPGRPLSCRIP